jgi:hypothetical protein
MPVIPGFERQRQGDLECETSLGYIARCHNNKNK